MDRTRHPKIVVGRLSPDPPERMTEALSTLRSLVAVGDPLALRTVIAELVPEGRLAGAGNGATANHSG
jgi:hypothetical protein